MHVLCASQQAHRGEQTDEAEVMVAVEMGDEDMVDLAASDLVAGHLHLGAFAAIHEEYLVFHGDNLCRGMTIESR